MRRPARQRHGRPARRRLERGIGTKRRECVFGAPNTTRRLTSSLTRRRRSDAAKHQVAPPGAVASCPNGSPVSARTHGEAVRAGQASARLATSDADRKRFSTRTIEVVVRHGRLAPASCRHVPPESAPAMAHGGPSEPSRAPVRPDASDEVHALTSACVTAESGALRHGCSSWHEAGSRSGARSTA
jgi:hypothetical protein